MAVKASRTNTDICQEEEVNYRAEICCFFGTPQRFRQRLIIGKSSTANWDQHHLCVGVFHSPTRVPLLCVYLSMCSVSGLSKYLPTFEWIFSVWNTELGVYTLSACVCKVTPQAVCFHLGYVYVPVVKVWQMRTEEGRTEKMNDLTAPLFNS